LRMSYGRGAGFLRFLAGGLVLLTAGAANADLIHLQLENQSRWIRAFGEVEGQTQADRQDAEGFADFNGFAEISLVVENSTSWASSYAYASQHSILDQLMHRTRVQFDMSIGASYQHQPGGEELVAVGETFFELMFRLDQPHHYIFRSLRDYTFAPNGVASLHDGGLFSEQGDEIVGDFWYQRVDQSGLLPPGRYILRHHGLLQPQNSIPETEALRFTMELVPIPLPAAAWTGLATLAGLGVVAGVCGWRRRIAEGK
jgi:hypothetical protein